MLGWRSIWRAYRYCRIIIRSIYGKMAGFFGFLSAVALARRRRLRLDCRLNVSRDIFRGM